MYLTWPILNFYLKSEKDAVWKKPWIQAHDKTKMVPIVATFGNNLHTHTQSHMHAWTHTQSQQQNNKNQD